MGLCLLSVMHSSHLDLLLVNLLLSGLGVWIYRLKRSQVEHSHTWEKYLQPKWKAIYSIEQKNFFCVKMLIEFIRPCLVLLKKNVTKKSDFVLSWSQRIFFDNYGRDNFFCTRSLNVLWLCKISQLILWL